MWRLPSGWTGVSAHIDVMSVWNKFQGLYSQKCPLQATEISSFALKKHIIQRKGMRRSGTQKQKVLSFME